MTLDVETPPPPELQPDMDVDEYDGVDVDVSEYRREDLETYLQEGAWEQAFGEWAEHTDMDEETFAIVTDLGLFERFDFWEFNRTTYRLFAVGG